MGCVFLTLSHRGADHTLFPGWAVPDEECTDSSFWHRVFAWGKMLSTPASWGFFSWHPATCFSYLNEVSNDLLLKLSLKWGRGCSQEHLGRSNQAIMSSWLPLEDNMALSLDICDYGYATEPTQREPHDLRLLHRNPIMFLPDMRWIGDKDREKIRLLLYSMGTSFVQSYLQTLCTVSFSGSSEEKFSLASWIDWVGHLYLVQLS